MSSARCRMWVEPRSQMNLPPRCWTRIPVFQAGAGDGDESVAGRNAAEGPFIKSQGVDVTQVVVEPLAAEAAALEQELRHM